MKQDVTIQDLLNLMYKNQEMLEKNAEEAEKQRKKSAEEAEKRNQEAKERNKELHEEVQDMIKVYKKAGLIQGKTAEESVYRSIPDLFEKRGKNFDKVERNVTIKKDGKKFAEYDVVAINGEEVMPIEVKNNLTTTDIDHFLTVQLPKFKIALPQYNSYRLLGGVGSLVMSESVERYAKKKGLYVFLQNGKHITIANDPKFRAKIFA